MTSNQSLYCWDDKRDAEIKNFYIEDMYSCFTLQRDAAALRCIGR